MAVASRTRGNKKAAVVLCIDLIKFPSRHRLGYAAQPRRPTQCLQAGPCIQCEPILLWKAVQ